MHVRHLFAEVSARAEIPGPQCTAVRNGARDLFVQQTSRIDHAGGWHIAEGSTFLKLLEQVTITGAGEVTGITLTGATTYLQYSDGTVLGSKPLATLRGITFQSNRESCFTVSLDVRRLGEYPVFGREYTYVTEPEGLLVCYRDDTRKAPVYLHLRSRAKPELVTQWVKAEYVSQEPTYVYSLATYQTTAVAIGYGETPEQARTTSLAASRQRPTQPLAGGNQGHETLVTQVATARLYCQRSLRRLTASIESTPTSNLVASLGRGRDIQLATVSQALEGLSPTLKSTLWLSLVARQYTVPDFPKPLAARLVHYLASTQAPVPSTLEHRVCQALQAELLYTLTGEGRYAQQQAALLGAIRREDTPGDGALAYLLQPQLHSKQIWQSRFDSLTSLTCVQGVALHRFDAKRYAKGITETLERETGSILWKGWLGHTGTLDMPHSAEQAGLYLFLVKELDGYGSGQGTASASAFWEATTEESRANFWT